MMAFSHDIAGGQGNLIATSVQSPNFTTGVSGWQIAKDGSAQFNNVTIRGGETVGGTTLLYNGTPAKGSLFCAIAETAGSDEYGNVYGQGFNMGVWSALSGVQEQHFGIDDQGNLYLANSSGATAIYMDPDNGFIGIYDSSGTGDGNLITSLASSAGTDAWGNAYVDGFGTYGSDGAQIIAEFYADGESGILLAPQSGLTPDKIYPPQAVGGTGGSGTGQWLALGLISGATAQTGVPESQVTLYGGSSDGTTSIPHVSVYGGSSGDMICDINEHGIVAANPTTANIAETWHTITLDSGWSVPSGYPAPRYRLLPDGNVQLDGLAEYSSAFTAATSLCASNPLPTEYRIAGYSSGTDAILKGMSAGVRACVQMNASGVIYATPYPSGTSCSYIDLSNCIYTVT